LDGFQPVPILKFPLKFPLSERLAPRAGRKVMTAASFVSASRSEGLSSKETRAVINLKLFVFGSLFLSMVAVVLTAYFLTSQAEHDSFELHFYDDANKILGNMGQNLQRTMQASDAYIATITSYAAHTNQTWPYVVIPDFSVTAEKFRSLCGAVYVNTYLVVENEQRKEWEKFTAKVGRKMADKATATIAEYNVMDWPITSNYTEWNVIYDYDEFDKEKRVCTRQVNGTVSIIDPFSYGFSLCGREKKEWHTRAPIFHCGRFNRQFLNFGLRITGT
jgi:hypothetical protein